MTFETMVVAKEEMKLPRSLVAPTAVLVVVVVVEMHTPSVPEFYSHCQLPMASHASLRS